MADPRRSGPSRPLKRLLLALSLSTAIVAVDTTPAQAMPHVVAGVVAFAATPIGGALISAAIGIGVQLIGSALTSKPEPPGTPPPPAIRGSVSTGGIGPLAFNLGYSATAGTLAYRGSWGTEGGTPNAYYTELRIISDVPEPNPPGFVWLNEKRATPRWDWTEVAQGFPIEEARVGGVDYAWIRYLDGTQEDADAFMLATFGARAQAPFTETMVGTGQSIVIVTYRLNPDLWPSGFPTLKVESDGIALYNVALDTTAGGSGPHRRNDPATWEPSPNLIVQVYNALMGVHVGEEWIWGGQNLPAPRLPAATWIAAINEAAATTPMGGSGGTEPQFWGGLEVTADMEPAGVIEELLLAATARIAEVGGIYKVLVGAPAAPVLSFDDGHVLATRPGAFTPFPRLEETHNGIQGAYVEPAIGWDWKDPPAIYSAPLEAEDGGKRLALPQRYRALHSGTVVQRVMEAAAKESRRWRMHREWLGPEASDLEPLDCVAWTSVRGGYDEKHFLVTEVDDDPAFLVELGLQELDPSDYDPDADPVPLTFTPVKIDRPPALVAAGWTFFPATIDDAEGRPRRPTIGFTVPAGIDDVTNLHVQARVKVTQSAVFDGDQIRYEAPYEYKLNATMAPATLHQARGKFVRRSTGGSEFTAWFDVLTDDVDVIEADLADVLRERLNFTSRRIAQILDDYLELATRVSDQDVANRVDKQEIVTRIGTEIDGVKSEFTDSLTVITTNLASLVTKFILLRSEVKDFATGVSATATALQALSTYAGPDGAAAEFLTQLEASYNDMSATGLVRIQAGASPLDAAFVRAAIMLRAVEGGTAYEVGEFWEVKSDGTVSRKISQADKQYIVDGSGTLIAVYSAGRLNVNGIIAANDIDLGAKGSLLSIITGVIGDNQVTNSTAVVTTGTTSTTSSSDQTIQTHAHTPNGGQLLVSAKCYAAVVGAGTANCTFRLKRAGVDVANVTLIVDDTPETSVFLTYIDTSPGASSVTWTLTMASGGGTTLEAHHREITCSNLKK